MDVTKIIKGYLTHDDWRVKENANTGYSFSGLSLRVSEDAFEEFMLENTYPEDVRNAHKSCYIKIHDVGYPTVYCVGHDLKKLLDEGLNGIPGKINTHAPKHLNSAINIMVNYLGICQMEAAGAMAFNNVSSLLAPFVKHDNLTYDIVKQHMQNFVFHMNISNRWGAQAVFSNITLDFKIPEDFKDKQPKLGGKKADFVYGDCEKEMNMINMAILDVMKDGDATGAPFTFPIITINLTKDFPWESEESKLLFKITSKYGLPYFQNFLNSDLDESDIRAMCCRLSLDLKELKKHTGGLFGSGDSTGSILVTTLNLPKLAYEANGNVGKFFELIKKYATICKDTQEIKRLFIDNQMEKNLYPYLKRYIGSFNTFFSTIGIVGGNEACLNLLRKDITTPEGKKLMIDTLTYLRKLIVEFQEETGHLYNLEATPAESTGHKLAKHDKRQYPDIITAGTDDAPYYTNSTMFPAGQDFSVVEAIEHQDELQCLYNSGTVLHF